MKLPPVPIRIFLSRLPIANCILWTDLLILYTDLHGQVYVLAAQTEVTDQSCHHTPSQYADTGPTGPTTDPAKTSVQCPCGEADQTPDHYLQSCSLYHQARQQIWPTCVSLKTKLWGSAEDLFLTSKYAALTGERI